ncbi:MAG: SBBP repeat-containing protein [Limisphaerales bacterium]
MYSTYFGGVAYDGAFAIVLDSAGNAYVTGGTRSTNSFPILDAFQPDYGGGFSDAFLAKFDSQGRLLFSTYFGGSGGGLTGDYPNAIALDPQGNIVVVGQTSSTDLPTTADAFQPDYGGGSAFGPGDGFIAKFTPDGAQLLYCSYFGGSGDEIINGLAIDGAGNICITGQTDSIDLPLKNPLQLKFGGGKSDGFVAKFDATLTNLIFSTYFGGENRDEDQTIAVDPAGFIYLCGRTLSTNFPVTAGAFQTNHLV